MQARRIGLMGLGQGSVLAGAMPLALATIIDLVALAAGADVPPARSASVSWVAMAAGVAAGCIMTLLRVLRRADWKGDAARGLRRGTILVLAGLGIAVGTIILRGHPEIPPDPPLLAAQVIAVTLVMLAWPRRRPWRDALPFRFRFRSAPRH